MAYSYAVIGSGRQGVAAAFDLATWGDAARLLMVDAREEAAHVAAATVNRLVGRQVAAAVRGDAGDLHSLRPLLAGTNAILSAAHYNVNLGLTELAISIGAHMCDLGGHTGVVRDQHRLHDAAVQAGVVVVPDCGMGPGLNLSMAAYVMGKLDVAREVLIWDGGLPQRPEPPWNFVSTFAMSGLTNEYDGCAHFLRHGRVVEVPCFADLEEFEFAAPIGRLEAFVTSGGLSTAPWTWQHVLERLENKTLRYPGHCARFSAYRDLGLLDLHPVAISETSVVPRDVFHALLEPRIGTGSRIVHDVCVMRVTGSGTRDGRTVEATIELVDRFDELTGFTAMQRLTGWHAAIVLGMAVRGAISHGVRSVESVQGSMVVDEGRRRGWAFSESLRSINRTA